MRKAAGKMGESKNKPVKRPFKKLAPEKLRTYMEHHPDAYLRELAEEFGCSTLAVLKALRWLGFTYKKRQSISKSKIPKR